MRTPKDFEDNLKNGIVTEKMLGMVLYSFNKRAKNYRDKEREYRHNRYDNYNNEEKYRDKKIQLYKNKEILLSLMQPKSIHLESKIIKKKVRYYDYKEEYFQISANERDKIIYENEYWDNEQREYVSFLVIYEDEIFERYYLYYEIDEFKFHKPIADFEIKTYNRLEIKNIGALVTSGIDINDILSVQFCEKVLNALVNNTAKIINLGGTEL